MTSRTVVTRFAPSPTGYLHVGGARTALFNWLLARHAGGRYLLRIEDTDLARSTDAATRALLEDLRWLGLHWDNEQLVFQSRRLDLYNRAIDDLIARGMAYKAYETPEELDAQRRAAERAKRPYLYRRPTLTDAQRREFDSSGRPHVVRFAMPVKEHRFHDVILGKEIVLAPSQVQDFVIRKTDGMPTYHFAVVIDDQDMAITHVLRGQEHLLNTVNHIGLMEALGYERPIFGHLPVILNTDGSKMGKRDRDKKVRQQTHNFMRNARAAIETIAEGAGIDAERLRQWLDDDGRQLDAEEHARLMPHIGMRPGDLPEILVRDFRESGYLPEALNNFLALLGWSPGEDRERMSVEEMVRLFALEDVGKANAKFNREKLLAFNTEAAAAAPPPRLLAAMRDYLSVHPESPLNRADDTRLSAILAMNAGFRVLRDVDEKSRFLLEDDEAIVYDAGAVEKVLLKADRAGVDALRAARAVLAAVATWEAASIEGAVKAHCEATQTGLGKVAQPIRVAVSGGQVSPPIFETLAALGRDSTLRRIDRCLAACG